MANFLWFSKAHSAVYRWTDGRVGAKIWHPMALLYTIGAKSRLTRTTPLQYYPLDDAGIIVIASNNGDPKPPSWWFNIRANPEFDIQVGREKRTVRAEQVSQQRKQQLWPQIRAINSAVDKYQQKSGRDIPVILLRTLTVQ